MPIETMQRPSEKANPPNHFIDFHAGAGGKYPGLGSIKSELVKRYGDKASVSVYNSVVFAEPPESNRFGTMKDVFVKRMEQGNQVEGFSYKKSAHSFGAPEEAYETELAQEEIDTVAIPKDKISTYLISPAIPQNRRKALRYVLKAALMNIQEFSVFHFQFPGKSRGYRSINSFTSVLPENFAEKKVTYIQGIRRAYSRLSLLNKEGNGNVVEFDPEPERKYLELFDSQKQQKVNEIDRHLINAIENGKRWKTRRLLHKRARLIRSEVNDIYKGKLTSAVGDEPLSSAKTVKSKEGKKERHKIVFDMFFRGKAFRNYLERAKAGEKITIVRPEFDILDIRKEINALSKAGKNVVVKIAEFATHAAPWAAQSGILRKTLDLPAP